MHLGPTSAPLVAGVVAALAALLVFLVVHHVWIRPIWMITAPGALIAILGGLAIGWAYAHVRIGLPAAPWTAPAVFVWILGVLTPAIALSYTHGPLFDLATATIPPGQGRAVAGHLVLELLVTATIAGAAIGYGLGRTPTAAGASALAALAFAIGPGHNIPMFGTNPLALKGHAIVVIIAATLAVTLVQVDAVLRRP